MITFEKFGKTVKIRNDDWKNMKQRFDVDNAEWDGESYSISVKCSTCIRHKYRCSGCVFWVFKGNNNSSACLDFLKGFVKPLYFNLGIEEIIWSKRQNKVARKQLGQILKMMDKIEKSQGGKNDKESKD